MRILLFGNTGQLGSELNKRLSNIGELFALNRSSSDYCGDFNNLKGIAETVNSLMPDIIVNASAYTDVDQAEQNHFIAFRINSEAVGCLAREAAKLNKLLVHYSTDYIFNGMGKRAWTEEDNPEPLNIYGESKLKGEQLIFAANCRHIIFRTSWVYGLNGDNFIKKIIALAKEKNSLDVIDDQIGSPISAELLADVTEKILSKVLLEHRYDGIYHLSTHGETSWFNFSKFIVSNAKDLGIKLELDAQDIRPVSSAAFKSLAKRPFNSRMDIKKIEAAFNLVLPNWEAGVEDFLKKLLLKSND